MLIAAPLAGAHKYTKDFSEEMEYKCDEKNLQVKCNDGERY